MSLVLITFKTNHTIIGEVLKQDETSITVKQPVQVIVQPTKEGNVIGFAPFIDYAEEFKSGLTLDKGDILCTTTPIRELENQYNQVFGVGIQIASAIPKV
jgi:hypothetical protein